MLAVGLRHIASSPSTCVGKWVLGWKRPDVSGGIETRLVLQRDGHQLLNCWVGKDLMLAVGLRRSLSKQQTPRTSLLR